MKTRLRKWDLREVEEFPGADRPKDIPQKWGWSEMDQKWGHGKVTFLSGNSPVNVLGRGFKESSRKPKKEA